MKVNVTQKPNRIYKARLFEMIFSEKEELLKLYNAMNGSNYQDPELLEINTLENAIYMSMKNDISFLIDSRLTLYEHQSTYNPNMPLRDLMYVADLYAGITKDENLYGAKRVQIPTPQFVVFYNGDKPLPDRVELKLSDNFTIPEETYALELKTILLNINAGHNQELMNSCKTLKDYSEYTAKVRAYAKIMTLEAAVERAIKECIENDVLADYLRNYRAEVKHVSIYEYDEEKHMRQEREASREEGLNTGMELGTKKGQYLKLITQVCRKLGKGQSPEEIADALEEGIEVINTICSVAVSHAPNYDSEAIWEDLHKYVKKF